MAAVKAAAILSKLHAFEFKQPKGRIRMLKKSLIASAGLMALLLGGSVAFAQTGQNVDWTAYTGDITGSRFKPLDQINASNFSKLEVAWRFKTDNLG
ncbi:MAG: hypothetical protein J0I19_15080, partial [Alphaproteobacteria bacterium]|nr:hypothetical protein [Alphaproteobacteria bacterium]